MRKTARVQLIFIVVVFSAFVGCFEVEEIIGKTVHIEVSPGQFALSQISQHSEAYFSTDKQVTFDLDIKLVDQSEDYVAIDTITFFSDKVFCKIWWTKDFAGFLEVEYIVDQVKMKINDMRYCVGERCHTVQANNYRDDRVRFLYSAEECAKEAAHIAFEASKLNELP